MVRIKSMDMITDHFRSAMTQAVRTERAGEGNPAFDPAQMIDARQRGLSYPKRSWEEAINDTSRAVYQRAIDRAIDDIHPGEPGAFTVYEGAIEDIDNATFLSIMQARGTDNYQTVMTDPVTIEHYDSAIADLKTTLDSIRVAPKARGTQIEDLDDQVVQNVENRAMPVALALHGWSLGEDNLNRYFTGDQPIVSPAIEHWADEFARKMTPDQAIRRFNDVWQDGPDWHGKTLAKADNWREGITPVNEAAANWFTATSAWTQEDWFNRTATGTAVDKWRNAFTGGNLAQSVDRFRRGFAPYHSTIADLPLDDLAPRHPKGSEENSWRITYTATALALKRQQILGAAPEIIPELDFGRMHEMWEDFQEFLRRIF